MSECVCVCADSNLVDDGSHELWVRLLIGQELPDDLVHDVLWREEVVQELGQDPGHHPGLAGQALTDPGGAGVPEWEGRKRCTMSRDRAEPLSQSDHH